MKYALLAALSLLPSLGMADILSCSLSKGYEVSVFIDTSNEYLLSLTDEETNRFAKFVSGTPMGSGELQIIKPYEKKVPVVFTRVGDKENSTTYGIAIEYNGYPIMFAIERWAEPTSIRYWDPYLSTVGLLEGVCND